MYVYWTLPRFSNWNQIGHLHLHFLFYLDFGIVPCKDMKSSKEYNVETGKYLELIVFNSI